MSAYDPGFWTRAAALIRTAPGTSAQRVRRAGALSIALGVGLVALSAGALGLTPLRYRSDALHAVFPVGMVGFVLVSTGGFRVIFGAEPEKAASASRRLVVAVLFCAVVIALLAACAIVVAQWLDL